ncbi:cytochrome c [Endozoicomonas sp. SM1973]|uniref:Cytochrome c n=1 Tax=Spartinivicinus marinus TaxID=2994442 RepID=A0A853HZ97_9GAMM|nr:cytochrome c [Spartinivicinus marinus]MCX4024844.1 cytochrome c [Spartinivicinus marinus]NYZ66513.1 cytochrome c [Spartinivicinus marinus]
MKILPLFLIGFSLLSATLTTTQAAGDIEAGKAKAALCNGCHGVNGISPNDLWPNLAGQKSGYLIKQLKAFRDNKRNDPMMAGIIKSLNDDDINNLAAYYSSLK